MREVDASEAKTKLSSLLDEVERGETIVIRRRGRRIARVVPEPRRRQEEIDAAIADLEALGKEIALKSGRTLSTGSPSSRGCGRSVSAPKQISDIRTATPLTTRFSSSQASQILPSLTMVSSTHRVAPPRIELATVAFAAIDLRRKSTPRRNLQSLRRSGHTACGRHSIASGGIPCRPRSTETMRHSLSMRWRASR